MKTQPQELLLDLAKKTTGSDQATARLLGVKKQQVSDWRHARQSIPIKHIYPLCEITRQVTGVWLTMLTRRHDKHRH